MNKFLLQKRKLERNEGSNTLALGARRAMRAAAALPALFSSMKLIVELIIRSVIIPTKSCQSGGLR
jgi:predicted acylesterase/phospholipase RssA